VPLPDVAPDPAELKEVSAELASVVLAFRALTLKLYVVEAVRFETVRASSVASDIQVSDELVPLPEEFTQNPVQRESEGEVEET